MPTSPVRFTSRTAQQIRGDLIAMIPKHAPSWTSHGEDELGIALVEMLAGVADGLHYYFDKQALETFVPSVQLPRNAAHLAYLVGYRPRRTLAAQGSLHAVTTQPLMHDVFIPAHTQFQTRGGVGIINTTPLLLPRGFSGVRSTLAVQGDLHSYTATAGGGRVMRLQTPITNPSEQLFRVTTYGEHWVEFRDSLPEDYDNRWYHYFEDLDGEIYLEFREDLGNVPTIGTPVRVDYITSHDISIATNTNVATPTLEEPPGLSQTEKTAWQTSIDRLEFQTGVLQGYRNREAVADLRYTAPLSIKTKHRAVSEGDYGFLARQFGGVKDLKVIPSDFYTRQIVAYVLMTDAETPSQETLDNLREYLNARNDLTLDVVTEPAVLQPFRCALTVKPAEGYTPATAVFDVREELLRFFRTTVFNFNRTLRLSEVAGRANRPASVDYVNILSLHWQDDPVSVSDLVPESEVHVPYIGDALTVSPIIEEE